jgi:tripartite-type tricarboxylate transporter receptor subunit TctC
MVEADGRKRQGKLKKRGRTNVNRLVRHAINCGVVGASLMAAVVTAAAAWPEKPIRFIVSFPPGGSADVTVRSIQPIMEKKLGQPVVIENRAGAGGVIGVDAVAKSQPDGYMIGLAAAGALSVNISFNEKMPYDPVKDLAPVTLLAEIPFILIAPVATETKSLAEVVAAAKAKPGALSIGHGGNGTAMHLGAQLFNQLAGVNTTLVPYRGSGPVAGDVLAGHMPLGVTDITSAISLIKDGKVKALGVSTGKRTTSLPDVPTFAEAGVPGYAAVGWFGVVAPAGTPPDIVAKLNDAIVTALNDPVIKERFVAVGAEPAPTSPDGFARYIKDEITKWSDVIAKSGIKAN